MPQDRYRPQPYEQCAKVLAKMGYEKDAKAVQIAKHWKRLKFKRDELPEVQTWDGFTKRIACYFYWLYGVTTKFGYYPFRAAGFLLAL